MRRGAPGPCAWRCRSRPWRCACSWIRFAASSASAVGEQRRRACPRRRPGGPRRTPRSGRRPTPGRRGRASRGRSSCRARRELDQQLEQPLLGARVERRRRLVEQQHVGVRRPAPRRSRRASSGRPRAGTARGRPGPRSRASRARRRPAASTSSRGSPELQRAERDLLAHRRREHLGVGVLEDEPDPGAEAAVENCSSSSASSVTSCAERPVRAGGRGTAGRRAPSAASTCRSRWRRAARRVSPGATLQRHAVERREAVEVAVARRPRSASSGSDTRHAVDSRWRQRRRPAAAPAQATSRAREPAPGPACGRRRGSRARPSPGAPPRTARAPCRTARRRSRRRTPRPPDVALAARAVRAWRAMYMSVTAPSRHEQVAVGHADDQHEQRAARSSAAQRRQQPRPGRRQREQHDQRDRRRRRG